MFGGDSPVAVSGVKREDEGSGEKDRGKKEERKKRYNKEKRSGKKTGEMLKNLLPARHGSWNGECQRGKEKEYQEGHVEERKLCASTKKERLEGNHRRKGGTLRGKPSKLGREGKNFRGNGGKKV